MIKNVKNKLVLFFIPVLCACEHKPPLLIDTIDGCKVYKVDGGYDWIYVTLCEGRVKWDRQEGKIIKHKSSETKVR